MFIGQNGLNYSHCSDRSEQAVWTKIQLLRSRSAVSTVSPTVSLISVELVKATCSDYRTFSSFKVYCFAPTASVSGNVTPDLNQSAVRFHNDVRFATVYRRIYCSKFLVIQSDVGLYL